MLGPHGVEQANNEQFLLRVSTWAFVLSQASLERGPTFKFTQVPCKVP